MYLEISKICTFFAFEAKLLEIEAEETIRFLVFSVVLYNIDLQTFMLRGGNSTLHPVIFRHEHPSILREAFLAMYGYVNVCKCKLISREHLRQILINNFIAVSLGKTNACIQVALAVFD